MEASGDGTSDNQEEVIMDGGEGEDVATDPVAEDGFVFPEHQDLVDDAAADQVEDVQLDIAPPSPEAPAPPTPRADPVAEMTWTEDARGYIRVPGRSAPIGRITCWGKSIAASCSVPGHSRCKRPYTIDKLPSNRTLPEWLIAGFGLDSASHMALPKPCAR